MSDTVKISLFETTTSAEDTSMFPLISSDGSEGWENLKISLANLKNLILKGVATLEDLEEINTEVEKYTILTSYKLSNSETEAPYIVQTDEAYTPRCTSLSNERWSKSDLFSGITTTKYLWTTQARVLNTDGSTTYLTWDGINIWSDPVCLGEYDHIGFDTEKYNYVYCNIDKTLEEVYSDLNLQPDTPLSFTVDLIETNKSMVDSITGIIWGDNRSTVTSSVPYEYCKVSTKNSDNTWGSYTKYLLMSHFGLDGKDGDNIEYIYYLSNIELSESEIAAKLYNDLNGTRVYIKDSQSLTKESSIYQQQDFIPDNWTDNMGWVSSSYPYQYMSVRKYSNNGWKDFEQPVLWNCYNLAMVVNGYLITIDNDNWSLSQTITSTNLKKFTTSKVTVTDPNNLVLEVGTDYVLSIDSCEIDGVDLVVDNTNSVIYLTTTDKASSVTFDDSNIVSFKVTLSNNKVLTYTINLTIIPGTASYNLVVAPTKLASLKNTIIDGQTIYISAYKGDITGYNLCSFGTELKVKIFKNADSEALTTLTGSTTTLSYSFDSGVAPKYYRVELIDSSNNILDIETIYPEELASDGISTSYINFYNDSVTISPLMNNTQLKKASKCYFDIHYGGDILPVYADTETLSNITTNYAVVSINDLILTDESSPAIDWDLNDDATEINRTSAYIYLKRVDDNVPLSATSATLNCTIYNSSGIILDTAVKLYLVKSEELVYNLKIFPQSINVSHDGTSYNGATNVTIDIDSYETSEDIKNLVATSKLIVTPYTLIDGVFTAQESSEVPLKYNSSTSKILTTILDVATTLTTPSLGAYIKFELIRYKEGTPTIIDWELIELNPCGATGDAGAYIQFNIPSVTLTVDTDGNYQGTSVPDITFIGTVYNGSEIVPYSEYTDDKYGSTTLDENDEGIWVYSGTSNTIGTDSDNLVNSAIVSQVSENGRMQNKFKVTIPSDIVKELYLNSSTALVSNYILVHVTYYSEKDTQRTVFGTFCVHKCIVGKDGDAGVGTYPTYIKNAVTIIDDNANDSILKDSSSATITILDLNYNYITNSSLIVWEVSDITFTKDDGTTYSNYEELKVAEPILETASDYQSITYYILRGPTYSGTKALTLGTGFYTATASLTINEKTTKIKNLILFSIFNINTSGYSYKIESTNAIYKSNSGQPQIIPQVSYRVIGSSENSKTDFIWSSTSLTRNSDSKYMDILTYNTSNSLWETLYDSQDKNDVNMLTSLPYSQYGYKLNLYSTEGILLDGGEINCEIDPYAVAGNESLNGHGTLSIGLTDNGTDVPYLNYFLEYSRASGYYLTYTFKNLYQSIDTDAESLDLVITDSNSSGTSTYQGSLGNTYYTALSTYNQGNFSVVIPATGENISKVLNDSYYLNWTACSLIIVLKLKNNTTTVVATLTINRTCENGYYFDVDEGGLKSIQALENNYSTLTQLANEIEATVHGIKAINYIANSDWSELSTTSTQFNNWSLYNVNDATKWVKTDMSSWGKNAATGEVTLLFLSSLQYSCGINLNTTGTWLGLTYSTFTKDLEVNKEYTITVYFSCPVTGSAAIYVPNQETISATLTKVDLTKTYTDSLAYTKTDDNNVTITSVTPGGFTTYGNWYRYIYTFKCINTESNCLYIHFKPSTISASGNNWYYISKVMMNLGSVAADWSDLTIDIYSSIDLTATSIISRVVETETKLTAEGISNLISTNLAIDGNSDITYLSNRSAGFVANAGQWGYHHDENNNLILDTKYNIVPETLVGKTTEAGAGYLAKGNFLWTAAGDITMLNADITGKITADSGTIGGWIINTKSLETSGDASLIINDTGNKLQVYLGNKAIDDITNISCAMRALSTNNYYTYNTALYLYADSAQYNYAFHGNGNGVLNGYMLGYKTNIITLTSGYTSESSAYELSLNKGLILVFTNSGTQDRYFCLPKLNDVCATLCLSEELDFCFLFVFINGSERTCYLCGKRYDTQVGTWPGLRNIGLDLASYKLGINHRNSGNYGTTIELSNGDACFIYGYYDKTNNLYRCNYTTA